MKLDSHHFVLQDKTVLQYAREADLQALCHCIELNLQLVSAIIAQNNELANQLMEKGANVNTRSDVCCFACLFSQHMHDMLLSNCASLRLSISFTHDSDTFNGVAVCRARLS